MTKFTFKKKYGQNFLKNESIANKIVSAISPTEKDLIIEIGPGAGAITKKLKTYGAKLIAFEIDTDTKKYLDTLEDDKTTIIYEDFLTVNIKEIIKNYNYEKLYIIGNLPYYITTPILEKIIDERINPESIVVMVQKEVGERFTAKPHTKEYGYMTVLLNYWFDLEKVTNVNRSEFIPSPNVDSMVIKLNKKATIDVNYDKFKKILMDSFKYKRKTISNNLKEYDKTKLEAILKKYNKTLNSRAEELELNIFIEFCKNI